MLGVLFEVVVLCVSGVKTFGVCCNVLQSRNNPNKITLQDTPNENLWSMTTRHGSWATMCVQESVGKSHGQAQRKLPLVDRVLMIYPFRFAVHRKPKIMARPLELVELPGPIQWMTFLPIR